MVADGGGDFPEAAAEGFYEAIRGSWRDDSIKSVVWIADAPPHADSTEHRRWKPEV